MKFEQSAGPEDHSAARADRLQRIARDVQERLDQLIPIRLKRRQARIVIANELDAGGLLGFDELRDVLGDPVQVHLFHLRRAAGAQNPIDERRKAVRFLDDHSRVGASSAIGQLPLEQLRGSAQPAERIFHLVRELADDPARQLLLRDERLLAAHLAVAPGIEQLEQQGSARARAARRGSRARPRDRRRAP